MEDTTPQDTLDHLLALVTGLVGKASQQGLDADALRAIAAAAADELGRLGRRPSTEPLIVQAGDLAGALVADYDQRQAAAAQNGGVVGVRSGISHLDEVLNGLEAGRLYLLAAVPGAGKTTLALQIAATVAQSGAPALYLSLENDSLDLVRKTTCRLGHLSYAAALKGKIDPAAWGRAVQDLDMLGGNLYLSTPRDALPSLEQVVEQVVARAGTAPRLIVIDYLQAWCKRGAQAGDASDVRERIDRLTPQLRALGERHGAAVLAISSQNRAGQAQGGMAALKESGDLEYGADVVMTLRRPTDQEKTSTDSTRDPRLTPLVLSIDKNRSGLTGRPIRLALHGDHCTFAEEER